MAIYDMTHANEALRPMGVKVNCLNARMGTGGNQVPLVVKNLYARQSISEFKQKKGGKYREI